MLTTKTGVGEMKSSSLARSNPEERESEVVGPLPWIAVIHGSQIITEWCTMATGETKASNPTNRHSPDGSVMVTQKRPETIANNQK
jgi:hypothetical protein